MIALPAFPVHSAIYGVSGNGYTARLLRQPAGGESVNKQDSHFFNFFSLVLGILITVAILIFAFARHVGASTQVQQLREESLQVEAVGARTEPFARVAVAGADNSA